LVKRKKTKSNSLIKSVNSLSISKKSKSISKITKSISKKSKPQECKYQVMKHTLYEWYHNMFEHLGWMILAKSQGDMEQKIVAYKHSLTKLKHQIECKINVLNDIDKKNDLHIMLDNVEILIKHANKDL
jgi:hypothetical protein